MGKDFGGLLGIAPAHFGEGLRQEKVLHSTRHTAAESVPIKAHMVFIVQVLKAGQSLALYECKDVPYNASVFGGVHASPCVKPCVKARLCGVKRFFRRPRHKSPFLSHRTGHGGQKEPISRTHHLCACIRRTHEWPQILHGLSYTVGNSLEVLLNLGNECPRQVSVVSYRRTA